MQHRPLLSNRRPGWHELATRFSDERECLASFLALETAEILEGIKPANLINIRNSRRECGRSLYLLWKRFGEAVLRRTGLQVRQIADRGHSVLLLIYDHEAMTALLARRNVMAFLGKAGYPQPMDLDGTLAELESRFDDTGFPHEIGVLLGYPLKDVAGFMGWAPLPVTAQGQWKIFGPPERSLHLAREFLNCRCRMARRLANCSTPFDCLQAPGTEQTTFPRRAPCALP